MTTRIFIVLLAACGAASPAIVPADPPATTLTPVTPLPPAALDDASVKANSHAFFDAMDRTDLAAFSEQIGPTFVLFEDGRTMDGAFLTKAYEARRERHAPIRSRTWSDEHVYLGGGTAVFIGEAIEHIPAEADHAAADNDGYNTLIWTRDGDHWKVAYWQWARAGIEAERQLWNDVFKSDVGFNKQPNALLVATLQGRKPGAALDLLMGQGRNAIYEASQGWKVTGVDISDEGLKIARATAAKQKLELHAIEADVDTWELGTNKWDLVTMIYAGADAKLVERIKPSLKKGGLFVLEYFHKDSDAAKAGAGGWATGELAALFKDGFKIVRDDVVDDIADYGMRQQKLVRFVAQKL